MHYTLKYIVSEAWLPTIATKTKTNVAYGYFTNLYAATQDTRQASSSVVWIY